MAIKKAKQKKQTHLGIIIGSVLGAVVIACIIAVGFLMSNGNGDRNWRGNEQAEVKVQETKVAKELKKAVKENGTAVEIEGHIITETPTYNPK
ncbi:hypothetical protein FACS1894192_08030 [Bacilli bacterium]|nr:hypothetical protein FACS1894192_08030 [Bacilli bacterium]